MVQMNRSRSLNSISKMYDEFKNIGEGVNKEQDVNQKK
jgi:hypothetical protein